MPGMACRALSKDEVIRVYNSITGLNFRRNRALFFFGLYTGFRIGEILSARLGDIVDDKGIKEEICLVETKTSKKKKCKNGKIRIVKKIRSARITEQLKIVINPWLLEMDKLGLTTKDCYLFGKRGGGKLPYKAALAALKAAYRRAGIRGNVATHTMRKTFTVRNNEILNMDAKPGDAGNVLNDLKEITGHSTVEALLHYIPKSEKKSSQVVEAYGNEILIGEKDV